ncbi:MAG: hypothetical protein A2901_05810 [Elusimicrobia bacterium RIFCSPLOWO2_01_FULL_54_10]|nr:MAG: hypothetical protein A2901_05810 [Elusimicrobia bacterium RIFCSPLOWO2_01_FULL_54_10]
MSDSFARLRQATSVAPALASAGSDWMQSLSHEIYRLYGRSIIHAVRSNPHGSVSLASVGIIPDHNDIRALMDMEREAFVSNPFAQPLLESKVGFIPNGDGTSSRNIKDANELFDWLHTYRFPQMERYFDDFDVVVRRLERNPLTRHLAGFLKDVAANGEEALLRNPWFSAYANLETRLRNIHREMNRIARRAPATDQKIQDELNALREEARQMDAKLRDLCFPQKPFEEISKEGAEQVPADRLLTALGIGRLEHIPMRQGPGGLQFRRVSVPKRTDRTKSPAGGLETLQFQLADAQKCAELTGIADFDIIEFDVLYGPGGQAFAVYPVLPQALSDAIKEEYQKTGASRMNEKIYDLQLEYFDTGDYYFVPDLQDPDLIKKWHAFIDERKEHSRLINAYREAVFGEWERDEHFPITRAGDIFTAPDGSEIFPGRKFDVILWNMPNMPGLMPDSRPAKLMDFWDDYKGTDEVLERFARELPGRLTERGRALIWNYGEEAKIIAAFENAGLKVEKLSTGLFIIRRPQERNAVLQLSEWIHSSPKKVWRVLRELERRDPANYPALLARIGKGIVHSETPGSRVRDNFKEQWSNNPLAAIGMVSRMGFSRELKTATKAARIVLTEQDDFVRANPEIVHGDARNNFRPILEQAQWALESVLQLAGSDRRGWIAEQFDAGNVLSTVLKRLGRFQDAEAALRRNLEQINAVISATRLSPNSGAPERLENLHRLKYTARANLASIHLQEKFSERKPDEAVTLLGTAGADGLYVLNPAIRRTIGVVSILGQALIETGRFENAAGFLEEFEPRTPTEKWSRVSNREWAHVRNLRTLAGILLKSREMPEAESMAYRAKEAIGFYNARQYMVARRLLRGLPDDLTVSDTTVLDLRNKMDRGEPSGRTPAQRRIKRFPDWASGTQAPLAVVGILALLYLPQFNVILPTLEWPAWASWAAGLAGAGALGTAIHRNTGANPEAAWFGLTEPQLWKIGTVLGDLTVSLILLYNFYNAEEFLLGNIMSDVQFFVWKHLQWIAETRQGIAAFLLMPVFAMLFLARILWEARRVAQTR